jgi:hypothetical protein
MIAATKTGGFLVGGAVVMLAAIDVDYYALTLTGFGKLLAAVVFVTGGATAVYRKIIRPTYIAAVDWFDEAFVAPQRRNEAAIAKITEDVSTIAGGNDHRTGMIEGIIKRMDVADQKIEVVAIKLAASQRNSLVPIVWTDAKGNVTDTTHGYHDLMGIDTHRARDKGWKQRIYAPERERVDAEWTRVAAAGHHDVMNFHVYTGPEDSMIQAVESDIQTLKMNDPARTVFGYQCTLRKIGKPTPIPAEQ